MKRLTSEYGLAGRADERRRMIEHYEQVSRNISKTCRFFGISRNQFYRWLARYRSDGFEGPVAPC